MPDVHTASLKEEGRREGVDGWSLYLGINQIRVFTLYVLCIQFTFNITFNQMATQLIWTPLSLK